MNRGQSRNDPMSMRPYMKSNLVENVQGSSRSSIKNEIFGGTLQYGFEPGSSYDVKRPGRGATYKDGWMALKSTPTTYGSDALDTRRYEKWMAGELSSLVRQDIRRLHR